MSAAKDSTRIKANRLTLCLFNIAMVELEVTGTSDNITCENSSTSQQNEGGYSPAVEKRPLGLAVI